VRRDGRPVRPPDIEIGAAARADRIRFGRRPETDVRFRGRYEGALSASEREGLPEEVEPGEEYRDVSVRWVAAAWAAAPLGLDDEEAQGER
jgi:hypothetical protein